MKCSGFFSSWNGYLVEIDPKSLKFNKNLKLKSFPYHIESVNEETILLVEDNVLELVDI